MSSDGRDRFIHDLSASGLVPADEIRRLNENLSINPESVTVDRIADELVQQKKLTHYQVTMIKDGKTSGLVLGDYAILERIGAGGMGTVYKARHRRMRREVAIKVLPSTVGESIEKLQRFEREVHAAARLTHPNIVIAHDAGEQNGIHYLVMEYVEGCDLADLVHQAGPLSLGMAVDAVLQSARGLEYAHRQGVVHRDIKPANLLRNREGKIKILDMGLARLEDCLGAEPGSDSSLYDDPNRSSPHLTQQGTIIGTVDFMSPEQVNDPNAADHRADIYSLGCTLFYLVTGRAPYSAKSILERLAAKGNRDVPLLREVYPEAPEQLEIVLAKMVARNPNERYPNANAVIVALEDVLNGPLADSNAAALVATRRVADMANTVTIPPDMVRLPKESREKLAPVVLAKTATAAPRPELLPEETDVPVPTLPVLHPVALAELPVGGSLPFALLDRVGQTLLAAGTRLSPRFVINLKEWGETGVWLPQAEIERWLGPRHADGFLKSPARPGLDVNTSATDRLDSELRKPNLLEVVKSGPDFLTGVIGMGAAPYSPRLVGEIQDYYEDTIQRVGELGVDMQSSRANRKTFIATASNLALGFLKLMRKDIDAVLAIVAQPAVHDYLSRHSIAMSVVAMALGADMRLDERNLVLIGATGLVHDVGMRKVPLELRDAPRRLRVGEFREVMKHVVHTADILEEGSDAQPVIKLVSYQVHERCNGTGYPRGRSDQQIHPFAKLLAAADVYTSLVSPRPYRRAISPYHAMTAMLEQMKQRLLEPTAVRSLLRRLSVFPIGSHVILSDERVARVIRANPAAYDRPILEVLFDSLGEPVRYPEIIDLSHDLSLNVVQVVRPPATLEEA